MSDGGHHGSGPSDGSERGRKRNAGSSPRSPSSRSDSYRSSTGEDDNRGHLQCRLGENLTTEFKIISVLGKGTFGEVLECWDRRRQIFVAVKVIRDISKYRDAARVEIHVLEELRRADPHRRQPVIQLDRWFDLRGHVCMVFERLGLSVFDFLRRNSYKPFPPAHVLHMSRQLLQAVAFMHRNRIIHTDLKPENILFAKSDSQTENGRKVVTNPDIRLIDLGSATFEEAHHTAIVSTRHYRAPEVILGLGWSYAADLWSVACIIIELTTGEALFQTHDDVEHLAMMRRVLGRMPTEMSSRSTGGARKYFDHSGELQWPRLAQRPGTTQRFVHNVPALDVTVEDARLSDLLKQMLRYEPMQRLPAARALEHPYFTDGGGTSGGATLQRSASYSSSSHPPSAAGSSSSSALSNSSHNSSSSSASHSTSSNSSASHASSLSSGFHCSSTHGSSSSAALPPRSSSFEQRR